VAGDPKEILENSGDPEFLSAFIERAQTPTTADINQTRVAAEVLLARTVSEQASALSEVLRKVSEQIARSAEAHAAAVVKSSAAAERHARSLKWATWALFIATFVLAVVAALQVWRAW